MTPLVGLVAPSLACGVFVGWQSRRRLSEAADPCCLRASDSGRTGGGTPREKRANAEVGPWLDCKGLVVLRRVLLPASQREELSKALRSLAASRLQCQGFAALSVFARVEATGEKLCGSGQDTDAPAAALDVLAVEEWLDPEAALQVFQKARDSPSSSADFDTSGSVWVSLKRPSPRRSF